MRPLVQALVLLALAAAVGALGRWGRRNAPRLAPGALSERDRAHRAAVLRRGGLACYVVAFLLAAFGVASAF
ncbi:hypothetical protein HFP15_33205 [Amycolatopsis sp. K13G38]|uniref:Uncharacterized protein n=1 Tax=Amycolatopsis acididurans TaxID=2724524 RepID=A0ABX1JET2_9PSEU|nr:hypothetical protein [Amycolatopsis acididurans]NKQ57731.1 hypothetical protein [Amycolatopsis acididurans]